MQVCLQFSCEPPGGGTSPSGFASPSPDENVIKSNLSSTAVSAVAALAVQQHQQQLLALASDLHGAVSRWCPVGSSEISTSSSDSSSRDLGASFSPVLFKGIFPLEGRRRDGDEVCGHEARLFSDRARYLLPRGCRVYRIPQRRVPIPRHLYREEPALEDDDGLPSLSGIDDDLDFICNEDQAVPPKTSAGAEAPFAAPPRLRSEGGNSSKDWGEWPLRPLEGGGEQGEDESCEDKTRKDHGKGREEVGQETAELSYLPHPYGPLDEEADSKSPARTAAESLVDSGAPSKKPYWETCKSFLDSGASSLLAQLSSFHHGEGAVGRAEDSEETRESLVSPHSSLVPGDLDGEPVESPHGESGGRGREGVGDLPGLRTAEDKEKDRSFANHSPHLSARRQTALPSPPSASVHEIRRRHSEQSNELRAEDEKEQREEEEGEGANDTNKGGVVFQASRKTPRRSTVGSRTPAHSGIAEEDSRGDEQAKALFVKSAPSPPSENMVGRMSSSSEFCKRTFSSGSLRNHSGEERNPLLVRLQSTTHQGLFGVEMDHETFPLSSPRGGREETSGLPSPERENLNTKRTREDASRDDLSTKSLGDDSTRPVGAMTTRVFSRTRLDVDGTAAPPNTAEEEKLADLRDPWPPHQAYSRHLTSSLSGDRLGDGPAKEEAPRASPAAAAAAPGPSVAPGAASHSYSAALERTTTEPDPAHALGRPWAGPKKTRDSLETRPHRHLAKASHADGVVNSSPTSTTAAAVSSSFSASSNARGSGEKRDEEDEDKKGQPSSFSFERQGTFVRSANGIHSQSTDSGSFARSLSSSSTLEQHTLLKDPVEAAASAAAAAAAEAAEAAEAAAALRSSGSFSRSSSSLAGRKNSRSTHRLLSTERGGPQDEEEEEEEAVGGGGGGAESERSCYSSSTSRCPFQHDFTHFVREWLASCAVRLRDFAAGQEHQAASSSSTQHTRENSRADDHSMHVLVAVTKRRLKDELKSYDLEFQKRYGRLPNRPEKEPLRHLYSHYQYLRRALLRLEYKNEPHNHPSNAPQGEGGGGGGKETGRLSSRGTRRSCEVGGGEEKRRSKRFSDAPYSSPAGTVSTPHTASFVDSQHAIRGDDAGRKEEEGRGGGGGRHSTRNSSQSQGGSPSTSSRGVLRANSSHSSSLTQHGPASSSSPSSSSPGVTRGNLARGSGNSVDSTSQRVVGGDSSTSSHGSSTSSSTDAALPTERNKVSKGSGGGGEGGGKRMSRAKEHYETARYYHEKSGGGSHRPAATSASLTERTRTGGRGWGEAEESMRESGGGGFRTSRRTEDSGRNEYAGYYQAGGEGEKMTTPPLLQGVCSSSDLKQLKMISTGSSGHQSRTSDGEAERRREESSKNSARPVGTVVVPHRSPSGSLQKGSLGGPGSFTGSCTASPSALKGVTDEQEEKHLVAESQQKSDRDFHGTVEEREQEGGDTSSSSSSMGSTPFWRLSSDGGRPVRSSSSLSDDAHGGCGTQSQKKNCRSSQRTGSAQEGSLLSKKSAGDTSFTKMVAERGSPSVSPAARLVAEKVMSSKLFVSKKPTGSSGRSVDDGVDNRGGAGGGILSSGHHSQDRASASSSTSTAAVTRTSLPSANSSHHRPHQTGGEFVQAHDDVQHRLTRLQQEKKLLRTKLLAYQADFVAETGRVVQLYKDIAPIEREYRRYKEVKQEILRLVEKQKTSSSSSSGTGGGGSASNASGVSTRLSKGRDHTPSKSVANNSISCLTYKNAEVEEEEEDGAGGIPSEAYDPSSGGARIHTACR